MKKIFGRKNKGEKTEYEQLRDQHAEYREACKDLEKKFESWDKTVKKMNKDGQNAATALARAGGIAGLMGMINGESISLQANKMQASIDQGKAMLKEIISQNSETRKLIDDREKAEKTMHSKENAADKAEKKSDEKAPQLRDEANSATEQFKLQDSQLMERLRNWQSTKANVFNEVYSIMSDVLTAPNSVGGGGGGGGGGGATVAPVQQQPVHTPQPTVQPSAPQDDFVITRDPVQQPVPGIAPTQDSRSSYADSGGVDNPFSEPLPGVGGNEREGEMRARALYDFDAEREEELSLRAGDIVTVIDDSDTDGWWEGTLNNVTGFFPGSYVEKI